MFDLGLSKMAVIGVVALVVIGPERLPRVARTVGTLLGRAQRYVNDIKSEVSREIRLDELKQMKSGFETAAQNVQNTIHDNMREHQNALTDAWSGGTSVASDSDGLMTGSSGAYDDSSSTYGTGRPLNTAWHPGGQSSKRKNWRIKQSALPAWYKRTSIKRTRVQSGAARVARHRPASLRRPSRFF